MEYIKKTPEQISENTFEKIGKQWMLITAEKDGAINTMTASWGFFGVMWGKNVAAIVVRPQRFTKEFLDAGDRITLSFYNETHRKALGHLGKVSGRDEDKIATVGFARKDFDGAPAFAEAQQVLVCKKLYAQPMEAASFLGEGGEADKQKWYPNEDYHTLYIAEIEAVYEATN